MHLVVEFPCSGMMKYFFCWHVEENEISMNTSLYQVDMFVYSPQSVEDPGEGPGGPSPLFLDQTEARRAKKEFFKTGPLLSQGLDPPLTIVDDKSILFNMLLFKDQSP